MTVPVPPRPSRYAGNTHVVADANTQTLRCTHCGEEIPFPLGRASWVVAVMRAFEEAHRACPQGVSPRVSALTGFAGPHKEEPDERWTDDT